MTVLSAEGICCGIRNEKFEYLKLGVVTQGEVRTVSFADINCQGEPVTLDVPESLISKFQPYKCYKVPFESRPYLTKAGQAANRLRISSYAVIEPIPIAAPGTPVQGQSPSPNK